MLFSYFRKQIQYIHGQLASVEKVEHGSNFPAGMSCTYIGLIVSHSDLSNKICTYGQI